MMMYVWLGWSLRFQLVLEFTGALEELAPVDDAAADLKQLCQLSCTAVLRPEKELGRE